MTQPDRNDLLLIRHAPADHGGRLCGRRDVAAQLPPEDRLAGQRRWLSACACVVTSPALRCRQTAGALFPNREPRVDAMLWEQDFGDHDGLAFDQIPDLGNLSRTELAAYTPPAGESFDAMAARVSPVLEALADNAMRDGPVAVVAHAGTVRAALGIALGHRPAGLAFEIAPLSITRLRCHETGFSIVTTNWQGPWA